MQFLHAVYCLIFDTFYKVLSLISKILRQTCEKLTKSITKKLIFTTLDTSQLKNDCEMMIVRVFIV